MRVSVYDYKDYKKYLLDFFSKTDGSSLTRSNLAKALNVQPSFISQVLNGVIHLSPEHAVIVNEYLDHNEEEGEFFLLLVHLGRSGNKKLRDVYLKQIERILKHREEIRERIQVKSEISKEDQMTYYSSWHYAATHVLVSLKECHTIDALSVRLGLPIGRTKEIVAFLESIALIRSEEGFYTVSERRIHLSPHSPLISKHHVNWRLRAMESLDHHYKSDLHYSTIFAVSQKDTEKIRKLCLALLEDSEEIIRPSPEETASCLTIDLFGI